VINIIMNACQALTNPEQAISVTTQNDSSGRFLIIEVRDEGCGISDSNIDKLATPFFTTKKEKGGSGLGLSICNSILQEHGGCLEFTSKENQGTTVRIKLSCAGAK
jgi:two-component system, NtrC family, sensor kinase